MIKIEQYPNAYKEVNVILDNMNIEDIKKIPTEFIDMIKLNMNYNYEFEIDSNKSFDQLEILKETRAILAYIFLNYWATDTKKI